MSERESMNLERGTIEEVLGVYDSYEEAEAAFVGLTKDLTNYVYWRIRETGGKFYVQRMPRSPLVSA
jgi:hypothetical protein